MDLVLCLFQPKTINSFTQILVFWLILPIELKKFLWTVGPCNPDNPVGNVFLVQKPAQTRLKPSGAVFFFKCKKSGYGRKLHGNPGLEGF